MDITFPGTIIPRQGKTAEQFLSGLFFATKGIMLVQVREITGLDTPAIQNWVNRGWVQKTVEKRYTADHLARIMLINMLRRTARLEHIAQILTYINGDPDDSLDDAIPDSLLYICVCDILDNVDFETVLSDKDITETISARIGDYEEPFPGAREKLITGIRVILLYYAAAVVKTRADRALTSLGIVPDSVPGA